jgi:ribosomal protein S12 methylthiotransferase accessory factor
MINWYNRIPAPIVDLRNLPSVTLQKTLDRFRSSPVKIHCCELTTDVGIPTYLAMMLGQDPAWPAVVISTATDLNPVLALQRALFELAANNLFVRSLLANSTPVPQLVSDIQSQETHALFYVDYRRLPHVKHLLSGKLKQLTISSEADNRPVADLDSLVKHLAKAGFEIIYADLTTTDVEELGFKVVKVIIPGMQPLDFGTVTQHLGSNRLYESPRRMGYHIHHTHHSQLNRFPHPFP